MHHSLLIILLLLTACSQNSEKDFAVLNYQISKTENKLSRALASESEPECRSDFFKNDLVVKENKQLEDGLEKKQKVPGTWKHLSLASLPTAQANFLLKYGKDLGDYNKNDYDFSLCQDVPCILNTIYNSVDGLEGNVIYYWYLKMGSLLAVDNKIYEQVSTTPGIYFNKFHEFKNYLFSRDELYGFWRLAQTLPPKYHMLTNLNEIQRLPINAHFENEEEWVCGLADNRGHIRVNDGCLAIGIDKNIGKGYFFQAVTHELTHELDYLTALSIRPHTYYYSHSDEWKKEGGWFIKEILDTSTGAIKFRQWDTNLDKEKFISQYAQTSPPEHYAETLALMYTSGEISKKTIPPSTYELVEKKFFDHKLYDTKNLTSGFNTVVDRYDVTIFKETETCLKNPGQVQLSTKDQLLAMYFPSVNAASVRNCLVLRLKAVAELVTRVINREQFYGCHYSKGETVKFNQDVYGQLSKKINHHYQAYLTDKEYFQLFSQFYKQFETIREAQIAYMSCQGENDQESCYEAKVKKQIIELMPPELEFKETAIADLLLDYLKRFPFTKTQDETMLLYQQFVNSSQSLITQEAQALWDSCLKVSPDDQETPLGSPFSARTQYVVSSLMNCLNQSIEGELDQVIENFDGEVLIKNEKEKRLLKSLSMPFFLNSLNTLLEEAVEMEKRQVLNYQQSEKSHFKSQLSSDWSWAKSLSRENLLIQECQKKVDEGIPLILMFHLKKDIFYHFSKNLCTEVIESIEFKQYSEQVYQSSWSAAEDSLKANLTSRATLKAKECVGFFPKASGILEKMNSKKRLSCFQDQWSYMEAMTLRDFEQNGLGAKYSFDAVELKQRYKIIATTVQEDIKKLYLQ